MARIEKSNVLGAANRALAGRPSEDHYGSMDSLLRDASEQKSRCEEVAALDREVLISPDCERVFLGDAEVALTPYAAQQIATLCGVPYPLLARVRPDTASSVLNQTFPRDGRGKVGLVERHPVEGDRLRCLTSDRYARIWDADILGDAQRWLLDGGWQPATPTVNQSWAKRNPDGSIKPCLFRSDRDSFAFFYGPKADGTDGLGGLRKGLMLWNSEVGSERIGFADFLFREFCANFTIWEGQSVGFRAARHIKGKGLAGVERDFHQYILNASPRLTTADLDAVEVASVTPFVPQGDKDARIEAAVERLQTRRIGLTKADAVEAMEWAFAQENQPSDPLSVWGVVNGITSAANRREFASERVDLQARAGRVLALATA